ncbi:hypothetical protein HZA55_06100 [Candidatus Poribacteria bacterium]|nr:hypothetical protein [Candidatus Poribacteria bacterium]
MKKNFILGLTILGFIFSLHTLVLAKWITLNLDGKLSYDDNHTSRDNDAGPTFSQNYSLTYEFPFITESPLKGTEYVTDNNTITSDSRNFRISANVSGGLYSLQTSRSEDTKEDASGGGTVTTRNDFSAAFTPKEKYLPQLRYTFNESDSDLSGAANTFDFKLSENIRPGDKISFDIAYSLSKNTNIISDQETQDQK